MNIQFISLKNGYPEYTPEYEWYIVRPHEASALAMRVFNDSYSQWSPAYQISKYTKYLTLAVF